MSNTEISWKRSLFTRLLAIFILLVTPIYILGIVIFNFSNKQLSEEILKATQTQVSYYVNNIDNDIQRIRKLQSEFIGDADLNRLSALSESLWDFEKTRSILRIQQRITAIQSSSNYVKSARVIIPALHWSINAAGTGTGTYTELRKEDYELMEVRETDFGAQIVHQNDRLYLLMLYPFYYDRQSNPLFAVEVELDKNAIRNELAKQYMSQGSWFALSFPENEMIINNFTNEESENEFQSVLNVYLREKPSGAVSIELEAGSYLFIYERANGLGMTLSVYIPENQLFEPFEKFKVLYFVFSLLVALFVVVYYFFANSLIRKPLIELINSFEKVERGDFLTKIKHSANNEIGFLFDRFNRMVENLDVLVDQVYKQKILTQRAELRQLQSQINPHFLYNSYFLLHRIIKKEDYTNAIRFSKEMGMYFEYITRSASDMVKLCVEVDHARIYTNFQAMRFLNRIAIEFDPLPDYAKSILVPKMIVQPIIENAFEHGLENKTEDGKLIVHFEKFENGIKITVEDNGEECDAQELEKMQDSLCSSNPEQEMTGILNINKRIRILYQNGSGVTVERSQLGGVKVNIIILTIKEEV